MTMGLEELRRELIAIKRLAADVDGELLISGRRRNARPNPKRAALSKPLPAIAANHRDRLPVPRIGTYQAPNDGT